MIYDISPPFSPELAVWPGDAPLEREIKLDMSKGDNLTLSGIRSTVHLGSHADAPSHYGRDAEAIHEPDLSLSLGPCQVIHVSIERCESITPVHLTMEITQSRVLFATGTYPDPHHFNEDFASLTPELVTHCHEKGVRLIGIDTPSVDPFHSKDLPSHLTFLKHDMAILEGLRLSDVPEGVYELIALPLKLVGFDASPVRAVLRALP